MKRLLLLPAVLSAGLLTAHAQLNVATGPTLTNYTNLFTGWSGGFFNLGADGTTKGPTIGTPAAGSNGSANWSGWSPNFGGTALTGSPITAPSGHKLVVEYLYLGETAGWRDDWGLWLNGSQSLLIDGAQTSTPPKASDTAKFAEWNTTTLNPGDKLDFFVNGTGVFVSGDGNVVSGTDGGKYFTFQSGLDTPAGYVDNSYWGTLTPTIGSNKAPFTVMAFEDKRVSPPGSGLPNGSGLDKDYTDLLFAFRIAQDIPQGGVPEPSTYGLIGAAALLGLVMIRRFKGKKA